MSDENITYVTKALITLFPSFLFFKTRVGVETSLTQSELMLTSWRCAYLVPKYYYVDDWNDFGVALLMVIRNLSEEAIFHECKVRWDQREHAYLDL